MSCKKTKKGHKKNRHCFELESFLCILPGISEKYMCPHCNKVFVVVDRFNLEWNKELENSEELFRQSFLESIENLS